MEMKVGGVIVSVTPGGGVLRSVLMKWQQVNLKQWKLDYEFDILPPGGLAFSWEMLQGVVTSSIFFFFFYKQTAAIFTCEIIKGVSTE